MKKLKIVLAIGISVCAAGTLWTYFYFHGAPQREITAQYKAMDLAFRNKDIASYMSHAAPEYVEVRLNGKPISRQDAVGNYARLARDWVAIDRQSLEIDRFVKNGSTATVTVSHTIQGTLSDSLGAFGKPGLTHKIWTENICIDTWQSSPQGWRLARHNMAMTRPTVDGKPFGVRDVHDND